MAVPFWAVKGAIFVYRHKTGVRERITFIEVVGSDILHFRNSAGELFLMPHPTTRELVMLTTTWAARAFNDRDLLDPAICDQSLLDGRQARYLDLDRASCMRHDPRCGHKYDLAIMLIGDKVPRSEHHVKKWLKTAKGPGEKPPSVECVRERVNWRTARPDEQVWGGFRREEVRRVRRTRVRLQALRTHLSRWYRVRACVHYADYWTIPLRQDEAGRGGAT